VTVDPDITGIQADQDKFLRIMQNLMFNAVKFTPSGGSVSVIAQPGRRGGRLEGTGEALDGQSDSPNRSMLHVIVSDTGAGIPAEHRERIFQAFQQVDSPAARQYHGTGLGLTVVRQLVELHGGRVWLDATQRVGSTFHVILPHALPSPVEDDAEEVEQPSTLSNGPTTPSVAARDPRAGLSVLVVEDIPAHLNLMRLAVTSRGHTVHGVGR
jgi:signal transduction histidine kinase